MKLAHLILVHKSPQQVERLIKRLCHKNSDVYVHLDLKCDQADFENLKVADNVYFIRNRINAGWGGYSIVQATINGFEEILNKDVNYSHINLLSGQDYPLKDISQIQDFLLENADKSFIKYLSIDEEWENGQIRVAKYSFGDFKFPGKYALQKLVNFLLPKRIMPNKLKPYGLSQWFTITPQCARHVVDYLKMHSKVKRFFRMTWGADELVFQTILLNSSLKHTIVNDNLRYIEQGNNDHPQILTIADASLLINSGKFFARKFDCKTDPEIFDHLDISQRLAS